MDISLLNYNVQFIEMPISIKGFTIRADGYFNVFLNARLDAQTLLETFLHEKNHIEGEDFEILNDVDMLELFAH